MIVSGLSGNEIYCLALKGFAPGELTVGNSVRSQGVVGSFGSSLRTLAGGEVENITHMISEGRHSAIRRMAEEAQRQGASGVTGVTSELKQLSGYTEFLSQGTGISSRESMRFFTSSASGQELYCHLDAGYQPLAFVMGNVAYALGLGRGLSGGLRTMARGEVVEYSNMYNRIRHLALDRLKAEAAAAGGNAVVDVRIEIKPFGPGIVELLMTGTAAHHPGFSPGPVAAADVVTSELTGPELWNLAKLGYVPRELVMATSVYSLGVIGGIGTMFSGLAAGELEELTKLIYRARENCTRLLKEEATRLGAERVVGNKLQIRELSQGLIEVIASGTALIPRQGFQPKSPDLIAQAIVRDDDSLSVGGGGSAGIAESVQFGANMEHRVQQQVNPLGCLIGMAVVFFVAIVIPLFITFIALVSGK